MPSGLSVDLFLRELELSGILSDADVSAVLRIVDVDEASYPTPEAVAEYLINASMLTRWQADKLLEGKHKGFLLGNYVLLDMLGQGAMGTVYLAEQTLMKRRCAVKLLHPTRLKDPQLLERFLREGRAVASTDHPNIVRAYELSRTREGNTDLYFLAMELATGRNLQTLVEQDGVLEYRRVGQLVRQVAIGLAHAHSKGLIHRDIKPTNLMLDDKGVIKILDLGLARFFDDAEDDRISSVHDSTFLGTAGYLAPEQALDSREVDARADLYSLGATAFYLLCGRPAFNEGTVVRRLMDSQLQKAPSPRIERADIPEELEHIVLRLLQPRPEDRFQSAEELVDAISNWLQDTPPSIPVTTSADGSGSWRTKATNESSKNSVATSDVPTVSEISQKTAVAKKAQDVANTPRPTSPSVAVLIPSDSTITRDPSLAAAFKSVPKRTGAGTYVAIGVVLVAALVAAGLWWNRSHESTRPVEIANGGHSALPMPHSENGPSDPNREFNVDNPKTGSSGKRLTNAVDPGDDVPTNNPSANRDGQTRDSGTTAFDQLRPELIPEYERKMASIDAGGEIPGLVGIFGDSRLNHWGSVIRCAFSPNEQVLASIGRDSTIRFWDLEKGHSHQTIQLSFEPTPESLAYALEGSRLLVGFSDGSVTSYGSADGLPSWSMNLGSTPVVDLAVVNRGESAWVGMAKSNKLVLVNAATGEKVRTLELSNNIRRLKVSDDETQLAVALSTGVIEVLDVQSGETRVRLMGHKTGSGAIDFRHDGQQLVSVAPQDFECLVWSLDKPTEPQRISIKDEPHAVAFLQDPLRILVANGWSVQEMDLQKPNAPKTLYAHYGFVRDIVPSLKHNMVATVSDDHQVVLRQLPKLVRRFGTDPANQSLKDIAISDDGELLAVSDYWFVRQWKVAEQTPGQQLGPYSSVMEHLAVRPDGKQVAGASTFETDLRLWDSESGKEQHRIPLEGLLTGVAYSPDSQRLAYGYLARNEKTQTGAAIIKLASPLTSIELADVKEDGFNFCLKWSRDNSKLMICGRRCVGLWDTNTGQRIKRISLPKTLPPRFRAGVLAPSGTSGFIGPQDGRVLKIDFETGEVSESFRHEQAVSIDGLAISPDGELLLIAAKDGQLTIRQTSSDSTGDRRSIRIGPTRGMVQRVLYSRDGRFVLTGNGNGTVYVLKASELDWR